MFFNVSEGIKEFCKQMKDNPMDWNQEHYEFVNKKHTDLRIWTCNGYEHIRIGNNSCLTYAEKLLIAKSIKMTIAKRLIQDRNIINP